MPVAAFQEEINKRYSPEALKPGYAPFCKHLFIDNFTGMLVTAMEINQASQGLLKTRYARRTEKELPVLCRYFLAKELAPTKAKFLDVILYSREQVAQENKAMGNEDPNASTDYEWAVVSVKGQDVDFELPMQPITMMRNSLGKEEGGSGVSLDRTAYLRSVEYWSKHAVVVDQ